TKRRNSIITSKSSTSCGWPRPVPASFWLMASDVSEQLRRQVAERAYHVCEYRLIHEDDTLFRLPGGPHHQPQARGPTEPANLAWASACWNNNKGSDLGTLVGEPPQLARLFHPR